MRLGKLLRELRKERGWQQLDLTVEMEVQGAGDVDRSTISHWETGARVPSPNMIEYLVRALGLNAEQERQLRLAAAREKGYLVPGQEIPFQVPRDVPYFVGRAKEMATLETTLATSVQAPMVCGIVGMGGVGKSALAAHFATRRRDLFPDGVLYASLREGEPLATLASFAATYGVDVSAHSDLPSRAAAVRSAMAGRRALIILDNAETVKEVREVLEGCGDRCAVLLTTRDRALAAAVATSIKYVTHLPVLTAEESLALLGALVSKERVCTEKGTARSVVELLGHLPLAVEIAGRLAGLRGWGMEQLLGRLQDERGRLDLLRLKDLEVRTSFSLSYTLLEEKERDFFATLSVFRGLFFTAEAAATIAQVKEEELPLDLFGDLSLLWREGQNRFSQHPLLADFCQEKLQERGQEQEKLERHSRYYLELAEREDRRLEQAETVAQAQRRLQREFGQIQQGQSWAIQAGANEIVARYARSMARYFEWAGPYRSAVAWADAGLRAARRLKRRDWEGQLLNSLGKSYYHQGKAEDSIPYYKEAIEIAREVGDHRAEGVRVCNLGNAHYNLGRLQQASTYYHLALKIAHEVGNRRSEGTNLGNLAMCHSSMGDMPKAIGYYEQALGIARETGDRHGQSINLGNLGVAYSNLGDKDRAIHYYEQALEIAQEIGDRRIAGGWLGNLGAAYEAIGDIEKAIKYHREGLETAREIGDRWGESYRLDGLGSAYAVLGENERAIDYYEQAVALTREIGDQWGEGCGLVALGALYYETGEVGRARSCWEQASLVLEPISDQRDSACDYAMAALGLAISDPEWSDSSGREELLAPVFAALQSALSLSGANPIAVRESLEKHVLRLSKSGVEGLEPVVAMLEESLRCAGNQPELL